MEKSKPRTSVLASALVGILLIIPAYFWGVASNYELEYFSLRKSLPDLERRLEKIACLSAEHARLRFQMDSLRAINPGNRSLQSRLESMFKEQKLDKPSLPTMNKLPPRTILDVGKEERVRLMIRNMTLDRIVRVLKAIDADEKGICIEKTNITAFGGAPTNRMSSLTLELSSLTLE